MQWEFRLSTEKDLPLRPEGAGRIRLGSQERRQLVNVDRRLYGQSEGL